jgi:hypothetical protein
VIGPKKVGDLRTGEQRPVEMLTSYSFLGNLVEGFVMQFYLRIRLSRERVNGTLSITDCASFFQPVLGRSFYRRFQQLFGARERF